MAVVGILTKWSSLGLPIKGVGWALSFLSLLENLSDNFSSQWLATPEKSYFILTQSNYVLTLFTTGIQRF